MQARPLWRPPAPSISFELALTSQPAAGLMGARTDGDGLALQRPAEAHGKVTYTAKTHTTGRPRKWRVSQFRRSARHQPVASAQSAIA
jgi:hypothetical protein